MAGEEDAAAIDLATWFTPMEAAGYAALIVGADQACAAIWERLKAGLIRTIATTASATYTGRAPATRNSPGFIPGGHWDHFRNEGANFWQTGDARFRIPPSSRNGLHVTYRCFGIKLDPADVRRTLPPLPPAQPKAPAAPIVALPPEPRASKDTQPEKRAPQGGRPPKEWWADLWLEMCRQIYLGQLVPKTQAAIERAIADWLSMQGHEAGEATIKRAARKLFGKLKEGDQNGDQN